MDTSHNDLLYPTIETLEESAQSEYMCASTNIHLSVHVCVCLPVHRSKPELSERRGMVDNLKEKQIIIFR